MGVKLLLPGTTIFSGNSRTADAPHQVGQYGLDPTDLAGIQELNELPRMILGQDRTRHLAGLKKAKVGKCEGLMITRVRMSDYTCKSTGTK